MELRKGDGRSSVTYRWKEPIMVERRYTRPSPVWSSTERRLMLHLSKISVSSVIYADKLSSSFCENLVTVGDFMETEVQYSLLQFLTTKRILRLTLVPDRYFL